MSSYLKEAICSGVNGSSLGVRFANAAHAILHPSEQLLMIRPGVGRLMRGFHNAEGSLSQFLGRGSFPAGLLELALPKK